MQVVTVGNTTQRLDFFTELLSDSVDLSAPFFCFCFSQDGKSNDIFTTPSVISMVDGWRISFEFDASILGVTSSKNDFNLYIASANDATPVKGEYQELIRLRNG